MSQLSKLLALINNATKVIEAQTSTDLSLDKTTTENDALSTPEVREAIRIIEGACAQLVASVARPSHTILNKIFAYSEPACIRAVVTLKVPDLLLDEPQGLHVSEIARRANVDQGKLARIMRLLATKHCFREVKPDIFVNNRLSIQLLSTNALSDLALHITDEVAKSATMLIETLTDPDMGPSYSPNKTPFNKYSGYPGSAFEYFGTDAGLAKGARFGRAMKGWGQGIAALSVINEYPWAKLPPGSIVDDLGGGDGSITMELYKAHPHLQYILQDLPQVISRAENEIWPTQAPQALKDHKIVFEPVDFLKETPVPGCDIYYLKNVMSVTPCCSKLSFFKDGFLRSHDWPNKECIQILSNVRAVMKPGSRVLVQEYVLQHTTSEGIDAGVKIAPEPLLPNYGEGRINAYNLDLDMMVMANSQERYQEDFAKLGEEAGLKIVKVWDSGDTGLVEFAIEDADIGMKGA
ncbi:hypothetical protein E1B28_000202 [Marasmius oreades]|uniref:O-methyltransferase domain-containing protein n=1 Tax=Marasmius oreades TaxID=181124 RepID=A0A9P7V0W8_9AGAR|nr:uncharacterized protein E1B28_000202 [Marasmius oreades]KAG7098238.1 hypothetical protein E1B28_000202 [Marasmius oreades]